MFFEDQEARPVIVLHDRDGKFTPRFCHLLKNADLKKLPVRSPNLNVFAERWVQSL